MRTHKRATLKPLPAVAGDLGSTPGSGRSPEGGYSNPLQYSCLENPHGQKSLAGYRPRVTKSPRDTTEHGAHTCTCAHAHPREHTLTHMNTRTQEHQAQHPCSWTHAREEGGWVPAAAIPAPPRRGLEARPGLTLWVGAWDPQLYGEDRVGASAQRRGGQAPPPSLPQCPERSQAPVLGSWCSHHSPGACAQGTVPSAPLEIRPWPVCRERKPRCRDARP